MDHQASIFRALYLYLRGFLDFFRRCRPSYPGNIFSSNIGDAILAVFSGLTPDARQLYDFERYKRRDFLTDFELRVKSALISEGLGDLLDDRVVFYDYMSPYLRMPRHFGYIRQGKVYPGYLSGAAPECPVEVFNFFKGLLGREVTVVIKPSRPGQREKFFWLTWTPGAQFSLDGLPATEQQVRKKVEKLGAYLISEPVDQADYAKDIFPYAINSIKILTMIDPQTNEPFAPGACHCFGTTASSPTDSLERGACWTGVDIKNGLTTKGFAILDGELVEIKKHPDTKKQLQSVPIPFLTETVFELLKQHRRINYLKLINWNVVMQNDGFILLSADSAPDLRAFQVVQPLVLDSRVFKFFNHYHVINRG